MTNLFADIAFMDNVKQKQREEGSRTLNCRFEEADFVNMDLSHREIDFIQTRDSFFQATVSETGWPYLQHRGGPQGFLKVTGPQQIAYADFRGNRQFISIGNLEINDRISLFLMDYPQRMRLKIWGRAVVMHAEQNRELMSALIMPDYRAVVERAVVINIEAWAWNCSQHIIPRFSEAELQSAKRKQRP